MTTRSNFIATAALLAAATSLSLVPSSTMAEEPKDDKAQLMLVQTAEDLKADGKTLRLVNVGSQTVYFSDRPVRIAGHMPLAGYLDEWTAGAGPDNFANDPPNATLSVIEPGKTESVLAVVEISHPAVDGNDLVYNYRLIEGSMPESGGATALFIDWIGVGGGVGPGFHGVGLGTRGAGIYGGYGGPRR